jgi:hypothetical protein
VSYDLCQVLFHLLKHLYKGEVKPGGDQNVQAMAHNFCATRGKLLAPEQVTEGLKTTLVKNLPSYTDVSFESEIDGIEDALSDVSYF